MGYVLYIDSDSGAPGFKEEIQKKFAAANQQETGAITVMEGPSYNADKPPFFFRGQKSTTGESGCWYHRLDAYPAFVANDKRACTNEAYKIWQALDIKPLRWCGAYCHLLIPGHLEQEDNWALSLARYAGAPCRILYIFVIFLKTEKKPVCHTFSFHVDAMLKSELSEAGVRAAFTKGNLGFIVDDVYETDMQATMEQYPDKLFSGDT